MGDADRDGVTRTPAPTSHRREGKAETAVPHGTFWQEFRANPREAHRGGACPAAIGRVLLLRQGSHLTDTAIRTLTPLLHRELSRLKIARTPIRQITVDDIPPSQH